MVPLPPPQVASLDTKAQRLADTAEQREDDAAAAARQLRSDLQSACAVNDQLQAELHVGDGAGDRGLGKQFGGRLSHSFSL